MPTSEIAAARDRNIPNFDRLARAYRWMEYLSFGPMLERCRFHFLPECLDARQALVLGDGDGRFTARLLESNPYVQVDAVDSSAAMLDQLQLRAAMASSTGIARLRTMQADIREGTPDRGGYDLVVSHFFLDCLTGEEVSSLIERTLPHLTPNAAWLVSEFAIPEEGWRRSAARLLVAILYLCFGMMTRLRVRKLPNYADILKQNSFRLQQNTELLGGLLVAQIWVWREQRP